jgi:hypothetical protein
MCIWGVGGRERKREEAGKTSHCYATKHFFNRGKKEK